MNLFAIQLGIVQFYCKGIVYYDNSNVWRGPAMLLPDRQQQPAMSLQEHSHEW